MKPWSGDPAWSQAVLRDLYGQDERLAVEALLAVVLAPPEQAWVESLLLDLLRDRRRSNLFLVAITCIGTAQGCTAASARPSSPLQSRCLLTPTRKCEVGRTTRWATSRCSRTAVVPACVLACND